MKLFISWSKDEAGEFALALHEWLPSVTLGKVDTWCSIDQIGSLPQGNGSANKILQAIKDSDACLAILTKENMNAPWLNFETGGFFSNQKPVFGILCGGLSHSDLASVGHPLAVNSVNFTPPTEHGISNLIQTLINDKSLINALKKSIKNDFLTIQEEYNKIFNDGYISISKILSSDPGF